ncbi:hypothetical protein Aduo_008900 [Ancylostoma duodenale]
MSKFGSVKSKITTAINDLNRTLARIDPSYLQPFSWEGSLRSQSRKLSKRNGGMIRARNTIRSAQGVLDERYEAAQLFISKQEDQGTLAYELGRHWEDLKGAELQRNARNIIGQLDAQIDLELQLENDIREKLAAIVVSNSQPLDRTSSQDTLLSEADAAARNNIYPRSSAAANSFAQVASPQANQAVQLRKVDLPTFDGDQGQFYDFWAKLKTMVHNNPALTTANKFVHLVSSLKGDAALVVESFDITDSENYELAIKAFLRRYDRPEFTHQHFLQKLEHLPPSSASASSQRATLCRIQACVLQLNRFEDTSQSLALKNWIRKKFPKKKVKRKS